MTVLYTGNFGWAKEYTCFYRITTGHHKHTGECQTNQGLRIRMYLVFLETHGYSCCPSCCPTYIIYLVLLLREHIPRSTTVKIVHTFYFFFFLFPFSLFFPLPLFLIFPPLASPFFLLSTNLYSPQYALESSCCWLCSTPTGQSCAGSHRRRSPLDQWNGRTGRDAFCALPTNDIIGKKTITRRKTDARKWREFRLCWESWFF